VAQCSRISRSLAAMPLAVAAHLSLLNAATATPISDQKAADIYKGCYDYCIGGMRQDDCAHICTCSARMIQRQMTLEEAMAVFGGQRQASPELQSRADAITRQCSR